MKGLILAGGRNSRLQPLSLALPKAIMPLFDKPMIYYPLATLMCAGIREIYLVVNETHLETMQRLLGYGKHWGIDINYLVETETLGIANAFRIEPEKLHDSPITMLLGDNIFFHLNPSKIKQIIAKTESKLGATILAIHQAEDPGRFGVVEFDQNTQEVVSIEEKPKNPKSNYIIPGLYFYDRRVVDMALRLEKSARGEYEISDLNTMYLKEKKILVDVCDTNIKWYDTGTPTDLLSAGMAVKDYQSLHGSVFGSPELIAYKNGWIDKSGLTQNIERYDSSNSDYVAYLKKLLE